MFSVMAWWRMWSRTAVAMTRSPKTSPQLPKLWLKLKPPDPRTNLTPKHFSVEQGSTPSRLGH
jgi:hypothetical protein